MQDDVVNECVDDPGHFIGRACREGCGEEIVSVTEERSMLTIDKRMAGFISRMPGQLHEMRGDVLPRADPLRRFRRSLNLVAATRLGPVQRRVRPLKPLFPGFLRQAFGYADTRSDSVDRRVDRTGDFFAQPFDRFPRP